MKIRHFALFSFIVALALASCAPPASQLLGSQAPNFTLSNLKGEKVELAPAASQKPTLLVFWATWCPTCKEEIPTLNEWTARYPQLQIFGIDVQESRDRVKAFAEKQKMNYPILLDENGSVAERYGLVGIPASVLMAKGGQIIYYGFALPENIGQLIQE